MLKEIEVEDRTYRIDALSALEQWNLFRRLSPLLAHAITPLLATLKLDELTAGNVVGTAGGIAALADAIDPAAEALARMPQEDSDYVMAHALKAVRLKTPEGYLPVAAPSGEVLFSHIKMGTMLRLVWEALAANLGSFFPIGKPNSTGTTKS